MESQHQDQNGQHQTQQLQLQLQMQHQQQENHQQHHQPAANINSRGPKKGSSRSRPSSRTRRLSSASFTGVINFGDSPASSTGSHARTPANRGRGRDAATAAPAATLTTSSSLTPSTSHPHQSRSRPPSHSHSKSHPEISTASFADLFSSFPPTMDLHHSNNGDERGGGASSSRPEKASKQQSPPHHSFTFTTPQNPRNMPGRKRARTLEFPTSDPHNTPSEDAKVKGGHSLRKRARIDYALMNEHEDEEKEHPTTTNTPPTHATDGPMEITVSGPRSARKRRATADPSYEEEDAAQAASAPLPQKKKPRTVETQGTVSPVPQRRPYQKRKSAVAAMITLDSPERQPPDTELKDTIEVGAPLANSTTTSSNVDGHSPSQTSNPSKLNGSNLAATNNARTTSNANDSVGAVTGPSVQGKSHTANVALLPPTDLTQNPSTSLDQITQNAANSPSEALAPDVNGTQSAANSNSADEHSRISRELKQIFSDRVASPENLPSSNSPKAVSEARQATPQPSSQESVDSDATEIVAPVLIPTKSHSGAEPSTGERSKMAARGKGRNHPLVSQEEPEEPKQDMPKLGLRPRRQRSSRLAENTLAAQEENIPSQPKEKVTPTNRKSDDKMKAADRSTAQDDAGPSSPDTPRRRGPGRPPKNRALPEPEPVKPVVTRGKERRASRTATRLEHPRPVRPNPPRDFSFLTPYLDTRDIYPEMTQDQESGMPTPLETPNLQHSDAAADEQAEEASSLGPDKESGSQDPQTALDAETGSNAATPAALYDAPTPATGVDSAAPSRNASPEPMIESMRKPKSRNQYTFPRVRSPSEFINHLDNHKNLSDEDLYNLLAASANALQAWQNEWKQQKAIVDDEDNAVRRRAHDIAFVAREARDLAKSTGPVTVEKKDFEVKGIRADRGQDNKANLPRSNPEAYERRQDMVAAQAWGFEWDPRPSMIGKQDPIGQRKGLQNTRLRNRPKLSQRAAEAAGDEPVGIVPGKRTRKSRLLSDESKEPSRAPTPVEPAKPKRRRRRNMEAELAESDNEAQEQQPEESKPEAEEPPPPPPPPATAAAPPAKKPYTGKKRGPKPKAEREALARAAAEREAAEQEAAEKAAQEAAEKAAKEAADAEVAAAEVAAIEAAAVAAQQEQNEVTSNQPKTRKRRRAAAGPEIQPQDIPTASIEDVQPDGPANRQAPVEDDLPAPKRQRARKPKVEMPTATFYTPATNMPTNEDTVTPTEEKRPSTASSTSSMRTVESSYSFRHRPRKNYSELADPAKEVHSEGRPKRTRKRANHHDEPEPTSYPINLAPAPYPEGPQYSMSNHGFHVQPPVLAPPNNNPFLPPSGGHPGPLLAPSPMRPGNVAAPSVVGANPFSAPNNIPVEPPTQHSQSPRRKPLRIKIINRRGQTATPQPDGPPQGAPHPHALPSLQQAQGLAPLQPPPSFHHGLSNGYDSHMYNGPSMTGSGPGQAMFPVNPPMGAAMSMPPAMHHGPPLPPLANIQGSGSITGSRANSKPPGSGRATPAPSSAASSTGGGGQAGDEALSEKDYASMTKSEKMSASMKARWANGSMRQAVNKRKETLARKKQNQADKSVTGTSLTPTPQPESAPASSTHNHTHIQGGPITPILHQPGPSDNLAPIALPPPHQQNQPPHGYGNNMHMMGGHDGHPGGGMVLPPPSSMTAAPTPYMMDGPAYPPLRREPARQNPFLDHGYADRGPRLPFLPNGPEDMGDGRYDHWGHRPQQ